MTEDQAHRFNVHAVMLTAELEMALVKLQAEREIGKNYAVLYLIVEGAFKLGYLGREDYDLLIKRYSRKLVDVTRENRAQRESSHVPVRTQNNRKSSSCSKRRTVSLKACWTSGRSIDQRNGAAGPPKRQANTWINSNQPGR